MTISWQGFTQFVQQGVAAIQAAATSVIDASVGSVTLAFQQAVAGTALWLQTQVIAATLLTRFATSYLSDADSWGAQFDYDRLEGIAASDVATFARYTATYQAVIPVGQLIQTGPGGVQFIVTADPTNAAYSATAANGQPGYIIPASQASLAGVLITCTQEGTIGNILANTLTSFVTPIPYVDTVTNPDALDNGYNPETDSAYKARFPSFIASLRQATVLAVQYAVTSLQQGVTCVIVEMQTFLGASMPGFFYALVDNGTGSPGSALLSAAGTAVDNARAAGIAFAVYGPTIVTVNVAMTVTSLNTALHAADTAAAQQAIEDYLSTLPDGAGLAYSFLPGIAFAASSNIIDVPLALYALNSGTSDIAAAPNAVLKPGTITVN